MAFFRSSKHQRLLWSLLLLSVGAAAGFGLGIFCGAEPPIGCRESDLTPVPDESFVSPASASSVETPPEPEPMPEKWVCLTFDDGPTPGITEWILAMLEKYDAKATFFVLGKNVEAYPDLFRRIVDAGHKVGNHTYSHQKGWGMSLERYIEDVDFANDLIHSELFRPPYARITPAQARALSQRYKLVMWDVLSRDYSRSLSPRKCLKNVTKHLEPGAIVVFHDSEKSFRNMRYALPRTLDKIRKLGLKCKTIEL